MDLYNEYLTFTLAAFEFNVGVVLSTTEKCLKGSGEAGGHDSIH